MALAQAPPVPPSSCAPARDWGKVEYYPLRESEVGFFLISLL